MPKKVVEIFGNISRKFKRAKIKNTLQKTYTLHESQDALFLACRDVQETIREAVAFLKERLQSAKTFQQLPWYLVLGPKSSGKTQLIAKSELPFLEKDRFVQMTPQGLESQGSVNVWLSSAAVLVDVPGTYIESPEELTPHRAAWVELLRQIRRYRFRRPLNGIIVALSVSSLSKTEDADLILQRLQEIIYRLKQRLPIYLVITQMDKVKGFDAYFDDLGKSERDQYAGMTFPLRNKAKAVWSEIFSENFDEFIANLHQRVLWRVQQEQDSLKRHLIVHFPSQLYLLKENLKQIIHKLGQIKSQTSLRGVYFTSSQIEEASRMDPLGEAVEQQFALTASNAKAPSLLRSHHFFERSFFIKSLFEQKIFPEARLAADVLQTSASRHENFIRWSALGLAGAILISSTLMFSKHYQEQRIHLDKSSTAISDYKLLSLAYASNNTSQIEKLLPALNALLLAKQHTSEAQIPWLLRFQLHKEAPLSQQTELLYTQTIETKLIPGVRALIAGELQKNELSNSADLYNLLKVYLMLGDPAHSNKDFLENFFFHEWKNPLMQNSDFRKHWQVALTLSMPSLTPDPVLLEKTRSVLNALPYELLSHAIFESAPLSHAPVSLESSAGMFVFPAALPPALFTPAQFAAIDNHINQSIYIAVHGNWVLGNKTSENVSEAMLKNLQETMREESAGYYVNAWQQFLSQIHLRSFKSLDALEQSLEMSLQTEAPLQKMLNVIHENTELDITSQNSLVNLYANQLNVNFHALNNLSLINMQNNLKNLLIQIQAITHNENPGAKAWEVASHMAMGKKPDVVLNLVQQSNPLPDPLKQWMLSYADQSRDLILSRASSYIWNQWKLQVQPICLSVISNHYPFVKSASSEVSPQDFKRFFARGGIFDQFFNDYLSPFVTTDFARWQWKTIDGKVFDNNSEKLAQFERANIIKEIYFSASNKLEVPFTLSDKKGEKHYLWPVNTQQMSVYLYNPDGKQKALSVSGDWSIFRLMDMAKITANPDGKTYQLMFENTDYKADVVLKAEAVNPFVSGVTDQFSCPVVK